MTQPMVQLEPGMIVTPTIRLVSQLGKGGMGSVWVAEHLALHTQVVVKFMSMELARHAESIDRFSREAARAAQVKSPHVVQMLDHGVTPGGIPFIVMEMLEGQDLAKLLAAQRRISLARTSEIIGQVCKALARAHERGIVHRDIKPDNIFLCEVGGGETFVKLLDFGIAKGGTVPLTGSSGTQTGTMIGTPFYMSPEQVVASKTIDLRTDLWSLGIVAYECVVGAKPLVADNFGALAILIHQDRLPRPSDADPSLPPAFDAWFAKACARNLAERFANARDLADGLHAVVTSAPAPTMSAASLTAGTVAAPARVETLLAPALTPSPGDPPNASVNVAPVGLVATTGGLGLATGSRTRPAGGAIPWILGSLGVVIVAGSGAWLLMHKSSAKTGPEAPSAASVVAMPPPAASSVVLLPPPATSELPDVPAATAADAAAASAPHGVGPPQRPSPPAAGHARPTPSASTKQSGEKDIF